MKKVPSLFPYLLVFCMPLVAFAESLNFNRDVRPILSENCFYCHGVDGNKREADLRLDLREDAIEGGAIVPGDLEESEMYYRIHSTEEDEIMPPPDSNRVLSDAERKVIDRSIMAGAGIKPGSVYGETDEFGWNITKEPFMCMTSRRPFYTFVGLTMRNLPSVTKAGNSACPMFTVMWSKTCSVNRF